MGRPKGSINCPKPFKCIVCGVLELALRKDKKFCDNCLKEHIAEWRHKKDKTEKYKERYRRYRIKIRERSRLRYHLENENVRKAHYYVSNAVRDKRLFKPNSCSQCGLADSGIERSMIEAHHYLGYEPEHWMDVQWLCTRCHKIVEGVIC